MDLTDLSFDEQRNGMGKVTQKSRKARILLGLEDSAIITKGQELQDSFIGWQVRLHIHSSISSKPYQSRSAFSLTQGHLSIYLRLLFINLSSMLHYFAIPIEKDLDILKDTLHEIKYLIIAFEHINKIYELSL